jgi:hypothetical protein
MYAVAVSAMLDPLFFRDLDEVFPFLSFFHFIPLFHRGMGIFSGFGGEKRKEKSPFSRVGAPELQGIFLVTKKHLVAEEERTRLSFLLEIRKLSFLLRVDTT